MITLGIIGLLIISYALWIKNERCQDFLFIIGGIFLLIYSHLIGDPVFVILQIVFIISATVELFKLRR